MCYNLAVEATRTRFQNQFGWDPGEGWLGSQRLNGFEHPFCPIRVRDHEALGWSLATWGLVPPWLSKDPVPKRTATLNARLETAESKPSFREAWKYGRAVVPATGFWEWRGQKKKKERVLIRPQEDWFYLAALASWWERPSGAVLTWTLLTTESAGWFSGIHERMPVDLDEKLKEAWLSSTPPTPKEIREALKTRPEAWLPPNEPESASECLFPDGY